LQHPLIAYSIKAAKESRLITRVIVNTDDEAIAKIAKEYGAEVPFIRPAELAEDLTTDLAVFQHQLKWHQAIENYIPDIIVQLRPTSPIRLNGWIDEGISKLINSNADSLRAVTESPLTPYKMWVINNNNDAMMPLLQINNINEPYNMPRQNLPTVYWQTGTLDIIRTKIITEDGLMSGKNIIPLLIPKEMAIDIDDVDAFNTAEKHIKNNNCIKFDE
jgi:CMP-N,N'-diacetyllegionaminic acid synthase